MAGGHEEFFKNPPDPRDSLSDWSDEYPLTDPEKYNDKKGKPIDLIPSDISDIHPGIGGIYRILQAKEHPYLLDGSRVINIGMVEGISKKERAARSPDELKKLQSIKKRLRSKFTGNAKETTEWLPKAERQTLTFQTRLQIKSGRWNDYKVPEGFLLRVFRNKYGEFPLMNRQDSRSSDEAYESIGEVDGKRRVLLPIREVMKSFPFKDVSRFGLRKGDKILYYKEDGFEDLLKECTDMAPPEKMKQIPNNSFVSVFRYRTGRWWLENGTGWIAFTTNRCFWYYNLVWWRKPKAEDFGICRYQDISFPLSARKSKLWGNTGDTILNTIEGKYRIRSGCSVRIDQILTRLCRISLLTRLK